MRREFRCNGKFVSQCPREAEAQRESAVPLCSMIRRCPAWSRKITVQIRTSWRCCRLAKPWRARHIKKTGRESEPRRRKRGSRDSRPAAREAPMSVRVLPCVSGRWRVNELPQKLTGGPLRSARNGSDPSEFRRALCPSQTAVPPIHPPSTTRQFDTAVQPRSIHSRSGRER